MRQWLITHFRGDEYKIQNVHFKSYASYFPNPQVEDRIIGKWDVIKEWRIRVVVAPNICM